MNFKMPEMEVVSYYKYFLKKKNQAQIQAEHYSKACLRQGVSV